MAFTPPVIERWADFVGVQRPLRPGYFKMFAIVGAPGTGKTTLAQNILVRRYWAWLKAKGKKVSIDPWADENPFEADFLKAFSVVNK